jgi:glyoxylase-like metal-dependent hydrolase (beta-lactamase superfamily II)
MEVAEGVHRLPGGVVNFYLVVDRGGFVLVDAGVPGDWDLLGGVVRSLGSTPDGLEAVLLTHAHPDHTGFAERARSTTGAAVRVHEADAAVARSGKPPKNERGLSAYLLKREAYRTAISLVRRKGSKIVPIAEVATFADGEMLDLPGRPRAVHLPGHTAGSSALFLEERGVAITGDSLVTRNPLTGRAGPQISPAGLNQDSDQALRSLDRLATLPARVLLPGHGEAWTNGATEAVRLAKAAGPS